MNTTLKALVQRIWRRAYLDTEEECARWIEEYMQTEQLHKPDVVRSLPFVTWLFTNYQMFHDKWIKLTGNGNYENPYTTGQPMLTWEEVIKEYEFRQ